MTCSQLRDVQSGQTSFPVNRIAWEIGSAFLLGALLEVSTHPKPGLVTPLSNGSHQDMDLQTFMRSSAAIAPCFYECAQLGLSHEGAITDLLPKVRNTGVFYEDVLLATTGGINTQRGYLFCAGVLSAATGYAARSIRTFSERVILTLAARMCEGLCNRELEQTRSAEKRTAGEILFKEHGVRGIRGEVEDGFPSVAVFGLPAYRTAMERGLPERLARIHALITLMSVVQDTTVLWRGGPNAQEFVYKRARHILSLGGAMTAEGMEEIHSFDAELVSRNLSPGGCADLLAVTIALEKLTSRQGATGTQSSRVNQTHPKIEKMKVGQS
ncbi:triphosphoribosyl-dephospho-CoA synthase MdcB [Rhodobacteraceae bacterium RKSG542]|uniref:triphosphoribosyl-dephospho-CoA synthase MdcB n=1 Tax=Pseudovibrio flavus TaxID=2529854 RepID=UPI0012BC45EE|nr:triphosphoribosyl-dephospho-CoA synthase MdcB [Pseudovibrio flavus]MTI16845.1 triphosphoribosyl-dephospho-CoA synthase MdcB [Pseudovibrio flavus]